MLAVLRTFLHSHLYTFTLSPLRIISNHSALFFSLLGASTFGGQFFLGGGSRDGF
jgi:hypothetical protein